MGEQRSSGFTSFFVLSLTLFARTASSDVQSFIFLFDEPGAFLHPIAQVNLQRVFESLAQQSQLVYATHSIFLVNKNVPTG
jgi:predicted ATP-dependent endonuclease of OLD family